MYDIVVKPGDFSQAQDRINMDGYAGGGASAPRSIYYGKVKLTFLKGTEPANGATFTGSYSSYYSDGSSATFTINRTTLSETNNVVTISLYSYRKNVDGFVTINAKALGGTSTTTVTIPFRYTSSTTAGGVADADIVKQDIRIMDGDIKLPSIYKPFFFNAALRFDEDNNNLFFYCSIANATPYRLSNGKYIIGTPRLTIDTKNFYFYNKESNITDIIVAEEEKEGQYFYVTDNNVSSLTKNYEVSFYCSIKRNDINPSLPHNYTFSVTEGAPMGYNGGLDISTAEDSLFGLKFFDKIVNTEAGNNRFYLCGEGIAFGGIRHFFTNEVENATTTLNLIRIKAIKGYEIDPLSWKSIHTYVSMLAGPTHTLIYNLYDREVKPEMIMESGANYGKYHFNFTDSERNHYIGLADRYTALDGTTVGNDESDYGIETTESPYTLYTKVPRHTSVLSVLYTKKI